MKDTAPDYPDDPDGDALRAIVASGSDMSRPMVIDFAIDTSSKSIAQACLAAVQEAGCEASLYQDDEDQRWSVYVPIRMIADYDGIVRTQKIHGELVADMGGTPFVMSPHEMERFVGGEIAKWKKVVEVRKIELQ